MEKVSQANTRRMYSWWWDSHISPKNSKWLQENLTDMDSKVKGMIKLLDQDADSFARRAEAYYKQRPELMKMVEEFYRAYRALAERYDHATGVIRQAQRTMIEAQIPMVFSDDSPSGSEPRTPNGEFSDDYEPSSRRKGWKQLSDSVGLVERVRKGLNFEETEEKEESVKSNGNNLVKVRNISKPDEVCESEEIRKLKEAIATLEAEKEASLAQYQESLDKLSQLKADISQSKEDFRVFSENASKAEKEAVLLREALTKVETEKETKIEEYQKSLEKISDLQHSLSAAEENASKLDQRSSSAEIEVESLKGEISKLALEKDESLNQYMKSLEMISNIENNLRLTEEDARGLKDRAENAENEVKLLKQTISILTQEKTDLSLQYHRCLEMISILENKLKISEEEAKRLNSEINNGVSKLKGAEEQCLLLERSNRSLHSELESLMLKMGTQTQELTEKQKEMGRLWACVQEERLRFVEAETAFQTLQHLHAQTQDELRSMASELNKRAQLLKVVETRNENLQDEVLKSKEENESSASSIKNMQNEISGLKESKGTLEEEVELRIDQRNALQQELYCLKEELNNLNTKHISILEQVRSVGMKSESFGSSVKELQDENSVLKETCHNESIEKAVLLGKMVILEQLIEKNSVLENSLSDLNAELEAVRSKIQTLEHSCQSLLQEKSTLLDEKNSLVIQLEETIKNLANLSENNTVLENSLADAHHQLKALKAKSNILEESCHLLANEKTSLISEKNGLVYELENTRSRLVDLGKIYGELEGRCLILEKEKESTLQKVEELQMSLKAERENVAGYVQVTEKRDLEMSVLHEEHQLRNRELDQVIDGSIENEIEIFVLRSTAQQLAMNNSYFSIENQKLLEEFNSSEKKITKLEKSNFEKDFEITSLSEQASGLRAGTSKLLKALNIFEEQASKDKNKQDNVHFNQIEITVKNMKESICNAEEENQQRDLELSIVITFIRQLQSDVLTVIGMNKALESKLRDESCNNEARLAQNENLSRKLIDTEDTCRVLQREKFEILAEKRSLMDKFLVLKEKNTILEKENFALYDEVLALDNLSLFFRIYADEKFVELKELGDRFDILRGSNGTLMAKLSLTEGNLEDSKSENFRLQGRLQKSQDDVKELGENLEKLQGLNASLTGNLSLLEGMFGDSKTEKFHLEGKLQKSKEENFALHDEVLALDNLSLIYRIYADEKLVELRELGDRFDKLQGSNGALMAKLCLTEEHLEDSKSENFLLQERLQKSQDDLKELGENLEKLQNLNATLTGNLSFLEGKFEDSQTDNFHLEERLQKSKDELKELGDNFEKLQGLNVALVGKVSLMEENYEDSKTEIFRLQEILEKSQKELKELANNFEKLQDLNVGLVGKLSLAEGNLEDSKTQSFQSAEKSQKLQVELKELGDNVEKLQDLNVSLLGKLSLAEGSLEDSKSKNCVLVERLQKSQHELKELGDNLEKLQNLNVALAGKLSSTEGNLEESKTENFHLQEQLQKSQHELKELCDNLEKLQVLNVAVAGKLGLTEGYLEDSKTENFNLQERFLKSENELNELSNNLEKLQDLKAVLEGKLSLTEGNLEDSKNENFQLQERSQKSQDELKEFQDLNCVLNGKISLLEESYKDSKTENFHLLERLQKSQDELKDAAATRDQLSNEIKDEKQILHQLELELNALRDNSALQEKSLQLELKNKMAEITELESLSSSIFGQLQFSMTSELIYQQKFHELHNASLGYLKENGDLYTQLAAYGPEVLALKECISSLEDHTDIHIKFQNPEFKETQDAHSTNDPTPSTFSDLCKIRERLQAIQKAAVEIKESMVQENIDLRAKLDSSTKQLQHLQSENSQRTRNSKPTSEITESDNATKDIMLDQVSDGSSYGYSKRGSTPIDDQIIELSITESDFKRVKSIKKQRNDSPSEKNSSFDKLEISTRFTEPIPEGNKKKVLERLDSDVQKLANLQITVQDLKRKLVVTEKDKRGKAVIECEALKGQLEEADLAVIKLFDLNGKLTKSIDDSKYFPEGKSSFDLEGEGGVKRRRVSEQARRMSEKIGRLQLEVQKLQFVLLKLGDNDGKSKGLETKRRVLLRDYLYGGGKKGQRRKEMHFCGCVQPSTVED